MNGVLDYLCAHVYEMNEVLGHRCAHVGQTGPGEPPDEGELKEMTLPSRHRIRKHATSRSPRLPTILNLYD